jgi:hypothetical protein
MQQATDKHRIPTYREVIDFYLRVDVSEALWQMSCRRVLKFFYFSEADISIHGTKAKQTTLHCLPNSEAFRDRISKTTAQITGCPFPFFPFFGMGPRVNRHGHPNEPIGWDMRFEVDFDLQGSFNAAIPAVAVLEHFSVPVLAKFSGHRSLHVIIPAEAFPSRMTSKPDHGEWMAVFERIANLLFRVAPGLSASHPYKDLELTAPYSLHRYHGLVGLPLSASAAIAFSPADAALTEVQEVGWRPIQHLFETCGIDDMFQLIEESEGCAEHLRVLSAAVFSGGQWDEFRERTRPDDLDPDSVAASIYCGLPGQGRDQPKLKHPEQVTRFQEALDLIDSPSMKSPKLYRLIAPMGFVMPFDTWQRIRLILSELLAVWVERGTSSAIDSYRDLACSRIVPAPVGLAVRITSLLPSSTEAVVAALEKLWKNESGELTPGSAYVAISLAESSSLNMSVLESLCTGQGEDALALKALLATEKPWETERRPDLAVAAILLSFPQLVAEVSEEPLSHEGMRMLARSVFPGDDKKLEYAVRRVVASLRNEKNGGEPVVAPDADKPRL